MALDHDVAGVGGGRGDEGNAADAVLDLAWARTHSAPVRVLPQPRPARTSQTSQSPPWGDLGGAGPGGPVPLQGLSRSRGPALASTHLPSSRAETIAIATLEFWLLHPHPSSGLTFLGGRRV